MQKRVTSNNNMFRNHLVEQIMQSIWSNNLHQGLFNPIFHIVDMYPQHTFHTVINHVANAFYVCYKLFDIFKFLFVS